MQSKQTGFSLTEVLVTVVILLILVGILLPHLQQAIVASEQTAACANLRAIFNAQTTFWQLYRNGYALTMNQLGGPAGSNTCDSAGLINETISSSYQQGGYTYSFTSNSIALYPAQNAPANCAVSGDTGFSVTAQTTAGGAGASYCIDETGVIRTDPNGSLIPPPCSLSGFLPLQ